MANFNLTYTGVEVQGQLDKVDVVEIDVGNLNDLVSTKASFKNGTGSFTAGGTTYTVTDAFITANTMVIVSPTGTKLGSWSVVSNAGNFVITSDKTETVAVAFDWGGTK
jgi:hypothetical protein